MNKPRLPTSLSKAWPGGFALRAPQTAYRISAAKGSVLAGDTQLWMMPPGASSFLKGSIPERMGDALAVAVEPRRPSRLAVSGVDCVAVIDQGRLSRLSFDEAWGEPSSLSWGLAVDGTSALFILFDGGQLVRVVPGSDSIAVLREDVRVMATDEGGALAFARFTEHEGDVAISFPSPPPDVLFDAGSGGRAAERHPEARRPQEHHDDDALHAPVADEARRGHRAPGPSLGTPRSWRHFGDGGPLRQGGRYFSAFCRAGEGIRTLDVHLGKVALYH
jgi:hypothetical protein